MRLLFTLVFGLLVGLFLIGVVLAFVAGDWKAGLGGLVITAPMLYALFEPWPRKPEPPKVPRERSPKQAGREPPP